jgi:hypothetical protein
MTSPQREPREAPGVGFHGKLVCLCEHNRTYCPHTEGECPWWDREPAAPTWHTPQGADH